KKYLSKPVNHKWPLSLDDLIFVIDTFASSNTYDDILFVTMLITSFNTLQRLGELVWPDALKHQSYQKIPLHHILKITNNSASYTFPYQKNSSLGSGCVILLLAEDGACINPLVTLNQYVSVCNQQFPHHPQIWLTAWGITPTRAWFMRYLCRFFLPAI
ncbi:hypothetical protein EV702DRAFT_966185, partial [Suillus placidus]